MMISASIVVMTSVIGDAGLVSYKDYFFLAYFLWQSRAARNIRL